MFFKMLRAWLGNAKRHDLQEALVVALLAMLTGGRMCVDMEDFRQRVCPPPLACGVAAGWADVG